MAEGGAGAGGGNGDLRSDSEQLRQKMTKIQDCEGGSTPGAKQARRGSHQGFPVVWLRCLYFGHFLS